MLRKLISGKKVDGVINAAHFDEDGKLLWVRAYERRGPTWSDLVLLDRQTLIQRLQEGKRFYTGKRIEYKASEFELGEVVRLQNSRHGPLLVTGRRKTQRDQLDALPIV